MPTAAAAPSAEPSAEQLQLAWRHLRGRNGCPDTLEATRSHRTWGIALCALARNMARREGITWHNTATEAAARLGGHHPVPPTPAAPAGGAGPGPDLWSRPRPLGRMPAALPPHAHRRPRGGHDVKRLAANDTD